MLLRNPGLLGGDRTASANGPGPQTLTMKALPPGGGYTLYAAAYSGANATGTMLSWGMMPLVIKSGVNDASLGLSVRIASGSAAADITQGPAGNQAGLAGAQWVQTSAADFASGKLAGAEVFTPALYTFLRTIGASGSLNGEFSAIEQIAQDRDGCFYVVDRYNQRIQKLDQECNVYVADGANCRIQKFDRDGKFLMAWGSGMRWGAGASPPAAVVGTGSYFFNWPHKIVVDREGNLWVGDGNNTRVLKFSPNGIFLLGIGNGAMSPWTVPPVPATGSADGYFWKPWGLAIDRQGVLHVADVGNSRIQSYSAAGNWLGKWGAPGLGDGQFPNDVGPLAFDPLGRLLVANNTMTIVSGTIQNYIQVFAEGGTYASRIGGQGPGWLKTMRSLTFDASGDLYVGEFSVQSISVFRGAKPTDVEGGVRLAGYRTPGPSNFVASGTYESPVLDAMRGVTWGSIHWVVPSLPSNTGVAIEVATSDDRTAWSPWQPVASTSGTGTKTASLAAYSNRFLKYRLRLSSSDPAVTPEVQEVGVSY
jgi:hypothetical protein